MKRTLQAARLPSQRGSVAVETALVFAFLVLFVTLPTIFWAFYFYQYSAGQKAVHHAALYLSTAPRLEMVTAGPDGGPVALTVARNIVARELGEGNMPELSIVCAYRQASGNISMKQCTVTNNLAYNQTLVQIGVSVEISYLNPLTGSESGMWISPYAPAPYIGN